ncbi:hypothetical protein BX667DRAFT_506840 [Coemansia mojavensis]|nr:hypothetical protein BX667DRAFT_506840 [Coemansia mojavensis]
MEITHRRQSRSRSGTSSGRGASWLRNNWTESETREVMEILVEEFISNNFTTAAYSKSHAPDERFKGVTFSRPSRELYNKVQNLRQRFFTPHSYLLRWAGPQTDARVLKRAEKSLMNPKTRDSIHGIFGGEVPEALHRMAGRSGHGEEKESATVKSVNYYSDIFRRKAPNLWHMSVEAYKLFLANRDLQSAAITAEDSEEQQQYYDDLLKLEAIGSPPMSLGSSAHATPSSALNTDFEDMCSDSNDDIGDQQQLVAVVGHSWHKFLALRSRWLSLGLQYASKEDWAQQEVQFLVQHLLTLADYSVDSHSDIPLATVPLFTGTFDAANIELAVNRAQSVQMARLATLSSDILQILQSVDTREPFTMLSLCWMTDRATRTQASLALLISHGSHGQPFGLFPHNDTMLARLVASSENIWFRYSSLAADLTISHMLQIPPTPEPNADDASSVAFAYAQNGFKYTFFSRRKGHFFEMTREEDWVPTIVPSRPRGVWAPDRVPREALLTLLRQDNEKLLAAMVELFGLRVFCYGFFDALAASPAGSRVPPAYSRRTSDGPAVDSQRRRNPLNASRRHRNRVSTSALPSLSGNVSSSSNGSPYMNGGLPYRRPPQSPAGSAGAGSLRNASMPQINVNARSPAGIDLPAQNSHSASIISNSSSRFHGRLGVNSASAVAGMVPFLSPQPPNFHSFLSADMAVMSESMPNSPFFGLSLDNLGQQQQQQQQMSGSNNGTPHDAVQLFPPLSDSAFTAAAAAVAATATTVKNSNNSTAAAAAAALIADPALHNLSGVSPATIAAAAAAASAQRTPALCDDSLSVSMYPSASALSSALASLGGVHVAAGPAAVSPAGQAESRSDNLLLATTASGSALAPACQLYPPGASSALGDSPAFWDLPGGLGVSLGSGIQSPDPHAYSAMSKAGEDAVAAAVASMELASQTAPVSVAIYPQQPAAVSAPAWEDMANSLSNVLGSPDMLMHIVQPSSTQMQHGMSAQHTPALDGPAASKSCGLALPDRLSDPNLAAAASLSTSSIIGQEQQTMAAYFGAPISTESASLSASAAPMASSPAASQLRLFANSTSAASCQMDMDLPTTSCSGC